MWVESRRKKWINKATIIIEPVKPHKNSLVLIEKIPLWMLHKIARGKMRIDKSWYLKFHAATQANLRVKPRLKSS